jgi:hypothetical protein
MFSPMCAVAGTQPASCSTFSTSSLHRLAVAVRAASGIEAYLWLVDVAGATRDDAIETLRWNARAMLRAALTGNPPPGS